MNPDDSSINLYCTKILHKYRVSQYDNPGIHGYIEGVLNGKINVD